MTIGPDPAYTAGLANAIGRELVARVEDELGGRGGARDRPGYGARRPLRAQSPHEGGLDAAGRLCRGARWPDACWARTAVPCT